MDIKLKMDVNPRIQHMKNTLKTGKLRRHIGRKNCKTAIYMMLNKASV